MFKKLFIYNIFLSIGLTSTVSFFIDLSNSSLPNEQFPSIVINGSWNNWDGWGITLTDDDNDQVFEGLIDLENGTYEYVIAGTGPDDDWGGWGQIIYAPGGSSCDFNPNDNFFNYGFIVSGNNLNQTYCAGSCDNNCNGGIQLSCEDESACNFLEIGNCQYPTENYNCQGDCIVSIDCDGNCGGSLEFDECGVCDGPGIPYGYCDCDLNIPGCTDTWELVWSDEFNGSEIDQSKWSFQTGTGSQYGLWGWGNGESQYYKSENSSIIDGKLVIEAKYENFSGSNYTSSRLRTKDKGDWLYGKFIARMKLPEAGGTWPAFWLLPTNSPYGGWPNGGEIDIMEHYGCESMNSGDPFSTVHSSMYNWNGGIQPPSYYLNQEIDTNEFHDYEMEWSENDIKFYIDGNYMGTYFKTNSGWQQWPFDQEFHIILNLAIGSSYMACATENNLFPQKLEVDYVRVFQLGDGCGLDGDINQDNFVNVTDVVLLISSILSGDNNFNLCYDLNNDSQINVTDIVTLVNMIIGPIGTL